MRQGLLLSLVLICLVIAPSRVYGQPKGMYAPNPFTGAIGGKIAYHNPMKGLYRPGVYYNPWTGKDVVNKSYYNSYTGVTGGKGAYNPYTGNHGYSSKGW